MKEFFKKSEEVSSFAKEEWEKVNVSLGIAVYDKDIDTFVEDVLIHADHQMYENKRQRKRKRK
jgi:GGDEF domain-containing protein